MKRFLSYEEMLDILDRDIPKFRQRGYDEVVAVIRGGMTAAHYIAKELRLPVGAYFPANSERAAMVIKANASSKKLLFVEDLVAKGRTFTELVGVLADSEISEWDFYPVLVDAECPISFEDCGLVTSDWIVFPYEKMEKMVEGDRGLFRMGSDVYDKAQ